MAAVDEERERSRYRRLPPRVRPTGTEHDVTPPQPVREVKYVSPFSPAAEVQAYEQLADYATREPRRSWRGTVALVVVGLALLAAVLARVI